MFVLFCIKETGIFVCSCVHRIVFADGAVVLKTLTLNVRNCELAKYDYLPVVKSEGHSVRRRRSW